MSADNTEGALTRRVVLRGVAVSGAALPLLAACSSTTDADGSANTGEPDASASPSQAQGEDQGSNGDGQTLARTSEVPVNGGTVLTEEQIVLTQPTEGEFKAFTAVCTHQGCVVASVEDGTINCDCHGSQFSAATGEVTNGPASAPLEEVDIQVDGNRIVPA